MGAIRAYLGVLRLPGYRWFWTGIVVSAVGAEVGYLALVWLVKETTRSAVAVGMVFTLRQILLALGSLLLGPLLDRGSRRNLMILDNALRALLTVLLSLLFYAGRLQLWHLFGFVALSGLLSALTRVGSGALTPALVGVHHDLLPAANALNQAEWQVSSLLGPALGGMLLTVFSPPSVLLVDAAGLAVFAWSLSRLPRQVNLAKRSSATYWRALAEGARWLIGSRPLTALTALTFLFNLLYGPLLVGLPFYVDDYLGRGAAGLGWMWSSFAAGSMVGGLAAASAGRWPPRQTLAAIVLLWGICTGPLLWVRSLPLALALLFLAGASFAPYNVVSLTVRQRLVPADAYGRVFALTLVVSQLGGSAGAWLGGWLVARAGVGQAIALAAACCLLLGLAAWCNGQLGHLDAPTQAA